MLQKCIAMFCVCVTGLVIADERMPDGESATRPAFAESFETVASEASKHWGADAKVRNLMPYTARLAGKDAQVDAAFLRQIVGADKVATRVKLAVLVLGRTGGKEARDCLYTLLVNKPKVGGEVAFYMSPNDVRDAAERMLANRKEAKLRIAAARWLVLVGDEKSLALLKRMSAGVDDETVLGTLNGAISELTRRLNDTPKDMRLQWAMQELRCLRARKETIHYRSWAGGIGRAAQLVVGEGPLSVPYLRSQIKRGNMLAVAIAGGQQETSLVDEIANMHISKRGGEDGSIWMGSLGSIGNAAAMGVLAKEIKPGDTDVNRSVARVLARYGTKATVPLLTRLSKDAEYKASWPAFKVAIERIKERLKAERQAATLRPSAAPASQPARDSR